jgi:hypothetical protein
MISKCNWANVLGTGGTWKLQNIDRNTYSKGSDNIKNGTLTIFLLKDTILVILLFHPDKQDATNIAMLTLLSKLLTLAVNTK